MGERAGVRGKDKKRKFLYNQVNIKDFIGVIQIFI